MRNRQLFFIDLKTLQVLFISLLIPLSSAVRAENSQYVNELQGEASTAATITAPANKTKVSTTPTAAGKKAKPQSYLDGLAAEAEDTNVDTSSSISSETLTKPNDTKVDHWNIDAQNLGTLRAGLSEPQFELILQQNYFSSYVFFKRLDPTSKNLVFKFYKTNIDIVKIRKKIISLSR